MNELKTYLQFCHLSFIETVMNELFLVLGIEKEYEQKVMPDGKLNIDGFLCLFDVSMVPSRPIERQLEFVTAMLMNLMKTKKPIVLVTTKNDEAFDGFVREAERLIARKEFKG